MATLFRKRSNSSWHINYRFNGRQYRVTTHTRNKKLALEQLKKLEVDIIRGVHDPSPQQFQKNNIAAFFKRYSEFSDNTKSPATNLSDQYRIKQMQEYFARKSIKYLEEITPGEIQLFQTFILSDRNERSYNNFLTLLKSMLNKAVEWEVIKSNPIKSCKPLKIPKKIRFFTIEEIEKLRDVADNPMSLLLDLAIYAGLRRSELYYLRWKDIDLQQEMIHIRAHGKFVPKNKKPATVPIHPALFTILKKAYPKNKKANLEQYIFGEYHNDYRINPIQELSKRFAKLAKIAGIKNAGLHVCRHTFASHLVQTGTPLLVVKELLRHSDIQSTMVYAHLTPNLHKQAIKNLPY